MQRKSRPDRGIRRVRPAWGIAALFIACPPLSAACSASWNAPVTPAAPSAPAVPSAPSTALSAAVYADSSSAGQAAPPSSDPTSPRSYVGCDFTGGQPFKRPAKSHAIYAQGWITKCTSPAPAECGISVRLLVDGPYGWYELPGGGDGSYGPCAAGKRVTAKYSCSPSGANDYQTEVTLTVTVGSARDSSTIYIDPNSAFDCE